MGERRRVIEGDDIQAIVERNSSGARDITLCSPFVTRAGMDPLLRALRKNKSRIHLRVISRFDEVEWLMGVTEPEVFEKLMALNGPEGRRSKKWDVQVWLVDGLHAKVIAMGDKLAMVGSANLTRGGLERNFELGTVIEGTAVGTVRRRLEEYIDAGVPLTPEGLAAKRERLKRPEYEAMRRQLEAMRNRFGRWRGRALKEFPDGTGRIAYAERALDLLRFAQEAGKPDFETLKARLNQHSRTDDPKADSDRLYMLEALGLLEDLGAHWRLAERGKSLLAADDPALALYARLRARWKDFRALESHLRTRDGAKPFKSEDLIKREGFKRSLGEPDGNKKESVKQYWDLRLRWLQSAGILSETSKKPKEYVCVPARLKSVWSTLS
jgi:hypothetical protein